MNMGTVGKIAGIGAGIAAIGVLAACSKPEDPQLSIVDEFGDFDRNSDNMFSQDEIRRHERGSSFVNDTDRLFRVDDNYVMVRDEIAHREYDHSMHKAYAAARGTDAYASVQELTALAMRFDKADKNGVKDGLLNGDERGDFLDTYGVDTRSKLILDRYETRLQYNPLYPDPPHNGGNGGGDTGGSGPNGPGDSGGGNGGYIPPNNGGGDNGGGDSGGSGGYNPPPDNGGYTPPPSSPDPGNGGNGGGDSTDNGNPDEGDF